MNTRLEVPEYVSGLDGRILEVVDLTQRHVEDFFKAREDLKRLGASIFELNGNLVRAAARSGVLIGLEDTEVDDLPAKSIQWLAITVDTIMADLVHIPDIDEAGENGKPETVIDPE